METITKEQLDKMGTKHFCGNGYTANIFVLGDSLRYKEYKISSDRLESEYRSSGSELSFEDSLYKQTELGEMSCISVPSSIVLNNSKIIGHLGKFEDGDTLDSLIESAPIDTMIKSLKDIEYDIQIMSEAGIEFYDLHDGNILYNEKDGLKIIDTDFFKCYKVVSSKEIERNNLDIIRCVLWKYILPSYWKCDFSGDKMTHYKEQLDEGKMLFSEFCECIQENMNPKIKTYNMLEVKKVLKRMTGL